LAFTKKLWVTTITSTHIALIANCCTILRLAAADRFIMLAPSGAHSLMTAAKEENRAKVSSYVPYDYRIYRLLFAQHVEVVQLVW